MGYILLCLLSPGAVAGCPGNKNNKEINTGGIYTTVSGASQTRNSEIHLTKPPERKYVGNYLIYVE